MFQPAGDLGLDEEPRLAFEVRRVPGLNPLERHLAVQLLVSGEEDLTQAARSMGTEDPEPRRTHCGRAIGSRVSGPIGGAPRLIHRGLQPGLIIPPLDEGRGSHRERPFRGPPECPLELAQLVAEQRPARFGQVVDEVLDLWRRPGAPGRFEAIARLIDPQRLRVG